jgi:hypothetical protein
MPLLSQTVLDLQAINGEVVSSIVTLPTGCEYARLTCPNLNPDDAIDPSKSLTIQVLHSFDGETWIPDFVATWIGGNDPPEIATVVTGWDGVLVYAIVSGNASTDFLCEVT